MRAAGPLMVAPPMIGLTPATRAPRLRALSMARRGAIPGRFGSIHPENLVPGVATITAGVLSVLWFVFIVLTNYPSLQYQKAYLDAGASYFLDKNTDIPSVAGIIAELGTTRH